MINQTGVAIILNDSKDWTRVSIRLPTIAGNWYAVFGSIPTDGQSTSGAPELYASQLYVFDCPPGTKFSIVNNLSGNSTGTVNAFIFPAPLSVRMLSFFEFIGSRLSSLLKIMFGAKATADLLGDNEVGPQLPYDPEKAARAHPYSHIIDRQKVKGPY